MEGVSQGVMPVPRAGVNLSSQRQTQHNGRPYHVKTKQQSKHGKLKRNAGPVSPTALKQKRRNNLQWWKCMDCVGRARLLPGGPTQWPWKRWRSWGMEQPWCVGVTWCGASQTCCSGGCLNRDRSYCAIALCALRLHAQSAWQSSWCSWKRYTTRKKEEELTFHKPSNQYMYLGATTYKD